MIKYIPGDTSVVFSEIPGEITLALNISGCLCRCPGCHSPYLREDIGEELGIEVLKDIVLKNPGISCVCLMGEGSDSSALEKLALDFRLEFPNLKLAIYSGRDSIPSTERIWDLFDYIKVGSYKAELGPLNSKTTNQRLYEKNDGEINDITYKFWKTL